MLRSMLDAHPNIRIPLESAFIKNLFPKYGKIKKWDEKTILVFFNELIKQPQFNLWTIDNDFLKQFIQMLFHFSRKKKLKFLLIKILPTH